MKAADGIVARKLAQAQAHGPALAPSSTRPCPRAAIARRSSAAPAARREDPGGLVEYSNNLIAD